MISHDSPDTPRGAHQSASHLIGRMKKQWPEPEWTVQEETAWLNLFTDVTHRFSYDEVRTQLTAWTRRSERRPRMAEIVRMVVESRSPRDDEIVPLSDPKAWAAFVEGHQAECTKAGIEPTFEVGNPMPADLHQMIGGLMRTQRLPEERPLAIEPTGHVDRKVCPICHLPLLPGSPLIVCADCADPDEDVDW